MYYKKSHKAWYVNRHGKPHRLGATEEEAKQALARLTTPDYTVSAIVEKFLTHHKMADGTRRWYTMPLNALKKKHGTVRVADLKPYHITEWADAPKNLPRAAKTCFHWAGQQEYITHSPLRNLKVTASKGRGDWTYLTPEQWRSLLRQLPADMTDLVMVMKETGCRPQEARCVESRHFDRIGRWWVFPTEESKSKREPRIVHLSDHAYEICLRLAMKHPEGPLFRNSEEGTWSAAALDGRFDRLSNRLGFKVIPYSLRHSWACEAILRGLDIITVARLLGHSNLTVLNKVYSHIQHRHLHMKESLKRATA